MENNLSPTECLERADMHDSLAEATADPAARAMHRAMAAEYRRRANSESMIARGSRSDPLSKLEVPIPAE